MVPGQSTVAYCPLLKLAAGSPSEQPRHTAARILPYPLIYPVHFSAQGSPRRTELTVPGDQADFDGYLRRSVGERRKGNSIRKPANRPYVHPHRISTIQRIPLCQLGVQWYMDFPGETQLLLVGRHHRLRPTGAVTASRPLPPHSQHGPTPSCAGRRRGFVHSRSVATVALIAYSTTPGPWPGSARPGAAPGGTTAFFRLSAPSFPGRVRPFFGGWTKALDNVGVAGKLCRRALSRLSRVLIAVGRNSHTQTHMANLMDAAERAGTNGEIFAAREQ